VVLVVAFAVVSTPVVVASVVPVMVLAVGVAAVVLVSVVAGMARVPVVMRRGAGFLPRVVFALQTGGELRPGGRTEVPVLCPQSSGQLGLCRGRQVPVAAFQAGAGGRRQVVMAPVKPVPDMPVSVAASVVPVVARVVAALEPGTDLRPGCGREPVAAMRMVLAAQCGTDLRAGRRRDLPALAARA
jgi:hypothetical protein